VKLFCLWFRGFHCFFFFVRAYLNGDCNPGNRFEYMIYLQNYCFQTFSDSFYNYHGKFQNWGDGKCGEAGYISSNLIDEGVCDTEHGAAHAFEFYSPSSNF
jgi:hypothetical protein